MEKGKVDRAKQFLPFDSLRGLREELAKRELKYLKTDKVELSEEAARELSAGFAKLKKGDYIAAHFYNIDRYADVSGKITEINFPFRYFVIDSVKISLDDLLWFNLVSE